MANDLQIIDKLGKRLGRFEYKVSNNKVIVLFIRNEVIKPEDLQLIGKLTNLEELHFHSNQISKIEGLEGLTNLEMLYLYDNQITKIEGLEKLTNLEMLYLHDNKITKIEGLDNLVKLRVIWFSNNPIPKSQIDQFKKQNPKIVIYA